MVLHDHSYLSMNIKAFNFWTNFWLILILVLC